MLHLGLSFNIFKNILYKNIKILNSNYESKSSFEQIYWCYFTFMVQSYFELTHNRYECMDYSRTRATSTEVYYIIVTQICSKIKIKN